MDFNELKTYFPFSMMWYKVQWRNCQWMWYCDFTEYIVIVVWRYWVERVGGQKNLAPACWKPSVCAFSSSHWGSSYWIVCHPKCHNQKALEYFLLMLVEIHPVSYFYLIVLDLLPYLRVWELLSSWIGDRSYVFLKVGFQTAKTSKWWF